MSNESAVSRKYKLVHAANQMMVIVRQMDKVCSRAGSSLQSDRDGSIFLVKPLADVMQDADPSADCLNVESKSNPELCVRTMDISNSEDLVRSIAVGWVPFAFKLHQHSEEHGMEFHTAIFEGAMLIPGIHNLFMENVVGCAPQLTL